MCANRRAIKIQSEFTFSTQQFSEFSLFSVEFQNEIPVERGACGGPPRAGRKVQAELKETELEARKFRLVTTFTSLKPYDSPYYHPTPNFSSESRDAPGVVWTSLHESLRTPRRSY